MKSARLFLVLILVLLFGQTHSLAADQGFPSPAMRSLVLPGWGERSMDSRERGLLFTGLETALWTFSALSWMNAQQFDDDLRYYAATHAGVVGVDSKNDKFLDDLADYESMELYNAQMLRNRRSTSLYSADQDENWIWDTTENRLEYQNIKLHRYRWGKFLEYSFGVIALNHLISAMDALYLDRVSENVSLTPELKPGHTGIRLTLDF